MAESPSTYHASKDDPEEWGDAVARPRSQKRKLGAMVSVRFSPQEEQLIRAEAERRQTSVSAFIREQTLKALDPLSAQAPVPMVGRTVVAAAGVATGSVGSGAFVAVAGDVLTGQIGLTAGDVVTSSR